MNNIFIVKVFTEPYGEVVYLVRAKSSADALQKIQQHINKLSGISIEKLVFGKDDIVFISDENG